MLFWYYTHSFILFYHIVKDITCMWMFTTYENNIGKCKTKFLTKSLENISPFRGELGIEFYKLEIAKACLGCFWSIPTFYMHFSATNFFLLIFDYVDYSLLTKINVCFTYIEHLQMIVLGLVLVREYLLLLILKFIFWGGHSMNLLFNTINIISYMFYSLDYFLVYYCS